MFGLFAESRPFKIRSLEDNKKYGVAAIDLKELLKKGCKLLKVPPSGAHVCLYADGTEVTEKYFATLPDNTELLLLRKQQAWGGAVCDIAHLLGSDQYALGLIEAAKGLLHDEKSAKRRKILTDLLHNLEDRSELESREEDKEWFIGVEARFKTKSAYLKSNCENRIRSYMRDLDEATKAVQKTGVREECVQASKSLSQMLKCDKYNGCYFDRSQKEKHRICTREGWFTCQGSFDQPQCAWLHSINPYSSRESRIMFSTWNLDHRIEKKRTIVPTLMDALQNHKCEDINLTYFYRLMFTCDNLKLVHIVCHKKEAHNLQCEPKKIFKADNRKHHSKKIRLK
ncbi:DNA fragmentation factor subunit beta [Nerophis ophidion]|uniref:DNA fragmentation factor subunit beta n=1 Tax=Nerophis ophidion TaxID=159077 RepID=UPI002ADF07D1|nr:DNA fragmentation factor subunit beta [Nerophis ophidion]